MLPVVEIVYIPSSEAFRKDHSLLESTLEITKNAKGCLGVYWGLQVEDKKTLYLVVVWNTYEEHYDLINDKSIYPTLVKDLSRCRSGDANMFHVPFEPGPASALNAPCTAFTHVYGLKQGRSGDHLKADLDSLVKEGASRGCQGGTVGKLIERDEYVFMFGFGDVDDLGSAISQKLSGTATKHSHAHVKFNTYKKYTP